jgi:Rrf2 family protein
MIRINRHTDYGVRILLALAQQPAGERISTSTVTQTMLIPPVLAQRIVAELARGGFILTSPGRDGGIKLGRPPVEINLLQVVEFFEGPIYLSDCLSDRLDCPFISKCPVSRRWERLHTLLRKEMESITFEELAHEASLADVLSPDGDEVPSFI